MTIGIILSLSIFVVISYAIEVAASKGLNPKILHFLTVLNLFYTLAYPMAMSFMIEPDFLLASLMHMNSVSLFLKLVSYHHVMNDVRVLNQRVKKFKNEKKELKLGVEGTILSVPQD